jgi:hypothetical protein
MFKQANFNAIGSGVFGKNYNFNRQLNGATKNLMFCKATVIGLNVPENSVNKHLNA